MACALAGVSACHRKTDPAPAPAPAARVVVPVAAKKGPTVAEQTRGMVEAVSQGKSQLPVQLRFELAQRPAVGQSLDINVAILPDIDASGADLVVASGEGFTVAPGGGQFELGAIEVGGVYRRTVKVSPTAPGVLVLNLTVSLKHDEMTESRAFSVPLIVER
jgi:hypothetical protein